DVGDELVIDAAGPDARGEPRRPLGMRQQADDGKGDDALAQVGAGGLSQLLGRLLQVEDVVGDLKRQAQALAESVKRPAQPFARSDALCDGTRSRYAAPDRPGANRLPSGMTPPCHTHVMASVVRVAAPGPPWGARGRKAAAERESRGRTAGCLPEPALPDGRE